MGVSDDANNGEIDGRGRSLAARITGQNGRGTGKGEGGGSQGGTVAAYV